MDYSNIMKELVNPSHHPGRSGKDLTHRKVFTLKAGELMPLLCEEMVPNDYFEVDTASLIRTLPMQTAAFVRARVHCDFFFVPKTAVWRNFNRFYYQRDDHESNYLQGFAYEPNITLQQISFECHRNAGTGAVDNAPARGKLAQLLGYGYTGFIDPNDFASSGQYNAIASKSLTVLPIMAYHRIYNMYYRNAWRDEPDSYAANLYSADSWDCSSYATSLLNANFSQVFPQNSMFEVHYHGWFSDLFMGSLPNQQFGSVSSVDISYDKSASTNQAIVLSLNDKGSLSSSDSIAYNGTPSNYLYSPVNSSFDVMTLRRALALQKWKEYNMRAGWKNRNQAKSMFGVSTPEDRKHEIEFIDGVDFPVLVDEVLSQNGASGGNLGEIAGKGIGVGNGRKIKFSCGERHGYLMCICYVMPMAEYEAKGIEKYLVRSEPFDHFVPAFENLGMEAIHKYELDMTGNATNFDAVLGYVPRYHEYKTRLDKVYGTFMPTYGATGGSLQNWVSVRRDLAAIANSGSIPTQYFYVNPQVLNTIFGFNADNTLETDQFICNVNIKDDAVRPMSDLGLPNL